MRLPETPLLPINPESDYDRRLGQVLYKLLRDLSLKVNAIAGGRMFGVDATATTIPVAGTWSQGDIVVNSAPAELGSVSSKYVVQGWQCLVGGTPGTWVAMRYLTGN